jgi:hypothetical protein
MFVTFRHNQSQAGLKKKQKKRMLEYQNETKQQAY